MALSMFRFTLFAANFVFHENGIMLENISLANCARECANSFCVGFGYKSEARTCYRLTLFQYDCPSCVDIEANVYTYTKGKTCHERNLNFSPLGDVCYSVENVTVKWENATEVCQERGGNLFEVTSDELDDFFTKTVFTENNRASIWIGGKCIKLEECGLDFIDILGVLCTCTWAWSRTREPIAVTRWGPGQPNMILQECLQYYYDGEFYKWDNEFCTSERGPVYCQYHD